MKTVKREAVQGDKILIIDPFMPMREYKKGDVLKVERKVASSIIDGCVKAEFITPIIHGYEYEVIVEENEQ